MTKIIFEEDEIKDIKGRLESLIHRGEKIDSLEFKKLSKQKQSLPEFLDVYEKKILEYIINNPGKSKQGIVESLDISRATVFKKIKNLVKYDLVKRPDTNARRHQLFENKESLIIRVEKDIKNFRKSYLNLLKRVHLENLEYQKKPHKTVPLGSSQSRVAPEIYSAMMDIDLTKILQQLVKCYALKAIFEWPKEIKDIESLNRLYLMMFRMLGDIFSEHARYSIPFGIQDEDERVTLLHESFRDEFGGPFGETILYRDLIQDFNKYGWNIEFDTVMSDLFTALNTGIKWKDYRGILVKDTKKHTQ